MNSVPQWLKKRITLNEAFFETKKALSDLSINTVCESGRCPNLNECFSRKFATFMILGSVCTRTCSFCSVKKGKAQPVDTEEPGRIADCVKRLGLKYVIVTSVTRDDLDDAGAGHFVKTVDFIRRASQGTVIELLIPDLAADPGSVRTVTFSGADIIGHNIETVNRLYPIVRKEADYTRSLGILKLIKEMNPEVLTKSAILTGLGETEEEIIHTMRDLKGSGCDILTIGQYLKASKENHPIARFVTPEEFERLNRAGADLGFKHINAGPFVRSSYMAEEGYGKVKIQK